MHVMFGMSCSAPMPFTTYSLLSLSKGRRAEQAACKVRLFWAENMSAASSCATLMLKLDVNCDRVFKAANED